MRSRAFTLIELLVTIAIITVLAGILLPAVIGAGNSAYHAECQQQLRQVGMALVDHEHEHNRYPAGSGRAFLADLFRTGSLDDSRVFVCPLSNEAQEEGWEVRGAHALEGKAGTQPRTGGTSYWGRKGGSKSIRSARARRVPVSQVPVACDALIADAAAEGGYVSPHGNKVHVLYLDGHVESIPLDEFLAPEWGRLGEHPRTVLGPR